MTRLKQNIEQKNAEKIILEYTGPITHNLLVELANNLKSKLQSDNEKPNRVLSVFSVFIEQAQNITIHALDKNCHFQMGVLKVAKQDERYLVYSENQIDEQQASLIQSRLDFLGNLTPTELRKYHQEQRRNKSKKEDFCEGTGFIEILRKSQQPLTYQFVIRSTNSVIFILQTTI